jgi:predicted nucleic-acid-binding Zn-ribbon protein
MTEKPRLAPVDDRGECPKCGWTNWRLQWYPAGDPTDTYLVPERILGTCTSCGFVEHFRPKDAKDE